MSELSRVQPSTLSIQEQADFILSLHDRGFMSDGEPAKETFMSLTREECDKLAAIGHRLARIAPYEAEVRRLVTGRGE